MADLISQDIPNLRIINTSFYPPGGPIDGELQHEEHRITETTQYFDISEVVDSSSKLPNTMPSVDMFIEHMEEMRVPKDAKIICYDHVGMFAVARVAWMFRYFGAADVRIMSGGFKKWIKEDRAFYKGVYDYGEGLPEEGDYSYEVIDSSRLITKISEVHKIARKLHSGCMENQITDARPPPVFKGEVAMPKGLRGGNIFGSINMPCDKFVEEGIMRP